MQIIELIEATGAKVLAEVDKDLDVKFRKVISTFLSKAQVLTGKSLLIRLLRKGQSAHFVQEITELCRLKIHLPHIYSLQITEEKN